MMATDQHGISKLEINKPFRVVMTLFSLRGCRLKEKTEILVQNSGEKLVTTSLLVADKFKKSHKFVLEKIDDLKCSDEFRGGNFTPSNYIDVRGKTQKSYLITEEGFMFIAMRFTGKESVEWQEKFIKSFQAMRKELSRIEKQRLTVDWQEARENGKCIRSILTDVVKAYERLADKQGGEKLDKNGKNVGRHYYSLTTQMVYKELFGDKSLKNVRDKLDALKLQFLSICEQSCSDEMQKLIDLEVEYHEIYKECKKRVIATVEGLSATRLAGDESVIKLVWDTSLAVSN
jgi:Rha family phage regulatory protein